MQETTKFRKDDTGTYTYMGEAYPGAATSLNVWSVMRITNATSAIDYADEGKFTQVWDNRASLTYA